MLPFNEMRPWTRNEKVGFGLGFGGIVVAILVGLSAFFVPEVRHFLGLERRPLPAPQSQPSPDLTDLLYQVEC